LCWQKYILNKLKAKIEKACKKKAEEVCLELATKYETKIKHLEEELNASKLEIEKYKIEMAKNEESMKKALMRGVCALNMEAMSIFNENTSTTTVSNTNANNNIANSFSSSSRALPTRHQEQDINDPGPLQLDPIYSQISSSTYLKSLNHQNSFNALSLNTSSKYKSVQNLTELNQNLNNNHSSNLLTERESKDLSKKVKQFCDNNLASNKNVSALTKAKMQLLKSSTLPQESDIQTRNANSEGVNSNLDYDFNSRLRKYDELIDHSKIPPQVSHPPLANLPTHTNNNSTKYSSLKSKTGSFSTTNSSSSQLKSNIGSSSSAYTNYSSSKYNNNLNQQPTSMSNVPPYKSVIIEKHAPKNQIDSDNMVKTTTTQVKYAMPMHTGKVLNKIVTTPLQY
jgi:hypothetical protein